MFKKSFLDINPIIIKDLRSRMRGLRPFLTLTGMLLFLAAITYGVYQISVTTFSYYSGTPLSPQIGQLLFTMLAFLLLAFVCIITPAVTAGAISSEKENLTMEMLLTTPLHPAQILWGKLVSAMSYVFLLIFAAIPIASLIFLFGGVSLRDMFKTLAVLIVISITLGIFGLFISTLLKRASRSTVVIYIAIVLLIVGSLGTYGVVGIINNAEPPRWLLVLNPVSALASAMSNVGGNYNSLSGIIPLLGADVSRLSGDIITQNYIPRPLYHYSIPIFLIISVVFYFLASRLIRTTRRWKITPKEGLIYLSLIAGVVLLTLGTFYLTINNYEHAVTTDKPLDLLVNRRVFSSSSIIQPVIAEPPIRVVEIQAENVVSESRTDIEMETWENSLAIEDQTAIFTLIITSGIEAYNKENAKPLAEIYLVQSFWETSQDGSDHFYVLSEDLKTAIAEQISNETKIIWLNILEDFDLSIALLPNIIFTFTPPQVSENGQVNLSMDAYLNGEHFMYTSAEFINTDGTWIMSNLSQTNQ